MKDLTHSFLQAEASCPETTDQSRRPPRSLRITSIHIISAIGFNYTVTALSSLYQHKYRNQAAKATLPSVEFKLSFGRVLVTSVLWWTLFGVESSETASTSGRKFIIGRLTSSILNPSSLILTELQKSLTSFDSFEKDVSLQARPRWNNAGRS